MLQQKTTQTAASVLLQREELRGKCRVMHSSAKATSCLTGPHPESQRAEMVLYPCSMITDILPMQILRQKKSRLEVEISIQNIKNQGDLTNVTTDVAIYVTLDPVFDK